jgi:hypothetical protein
MTIMAGVNRRPGPRLEQARTVGWLGGQDHGMVEQGVTDLSALHGY